MNVTAITYFVAAIVMAAVAVIGLKRATRDLANWTFVLGIFLLALELLLGGLSLRAPTLGQAEVWQQWRLLALSVSPGLWLMFSLAFARGNAGVFIRRWRPMWIAALLVPVAIAAMFHGDLYGAIETPPDRQWILRLQWPGFAVYTTVLIGSVLMLMNIERTYRASFGTIRWRIKFMLLAVGVIFIVRLYTCSQALLYQAVDPVIEGVNAIAAMIAAAIFVRAFLRTSRFEGDVYPSQSLLEGSLIVTMAGIYLLVVGVFARLLAQLGGTGGFALTAFLLLAALVILAMLLQSDRVRLYVRQTVSRNFQRPIYDYRSIWLKFAEGTSSRVEQGELCRAIVTLTGEIFQALSVSIWLRNDEHHTLRLAASTSHSGQKITESTPTDDEVDEVTRYFERNPEPVEFEPIQQPWAASLRRWHPNEFPNGGARLCAPLVRQGKLIGVLVIGDRVKGVAFPEQDLDLLKCVAEQASSSLLTIQLSGRLSQARELEAFQTMAAFFVHDLKNAASTLHLMLKNLPIHFNDPAFREDALRGIAKTVDHINRLIGRLSQLRHEIKIQSKPCDLNGVIANVVAGMQKAVEAKVVVSAASLPPVTLDQEQIQKVVTNLLLNAAEAATQNGEIHVATEQHNGWVTVTVADNGCGMTPEFIQRSLFRPFQTTKKTGLGIGMFQSKMIVEAHGGRFSVTSTVGKGTTFQVHLPTHG